MPAKSKNVNLEKMFIHHNIKNLHKDSKNIRIKRCYKNFY